MKIEPTPVIGHFLLHSVLSDSPPNRALKSVFDTLGYAVQEYAPEPASGSGQLVVSFGIRWIISNVWKIHWRKYAAFSCTSEDPVAVAAILSFIWRRPLIFISDEIKSGSYRGDRPEYWKRICRWSMRRASLTIVNDSARMNLQREYADLSDRNPIVVYPGCYLAPPKSENIAPLRERWGVTKGQKVLCFSGACDLLTGIDLALDSLKSRKDIYLVTQPLAINKLDRFFLDRLIYSDRIFVQQERLSWNDAWASAAAADVGVAIYRNQAPQFQNMGISSNRLCMFLAMGVPVIVNKQPSFDFLHEYECGIQVETQDEFNDALETILGDLERYKANALRCTAEYIDTQGKYLVLKEAVYRALQRG